MLCAQTEVLGNDWRKRRAAIPTAGRSWRESNFHPPEVELLLSDMSASSPVPLDGMANADADGRYTNGGLAGDGSGDVRMPDDAEGTVALGDDAHHAGTLDAQSSGDPTQSAGGDGRGPGSPHKSNSYREPQPKVLALFFCCGTFFVLGRPPPLSVLSFLLPCARLCPVSPWKNLGLRHFHRACRPRCCTGWARLAEQGLHR